MPKPPPISRDDDLIDVGQWIAVRANPPDIRSGDGSPSYPRPALPPGDEDFTMSGNIFSYHKMFGDEGLLLTSNG